jgi:membrane-associated phospholipid phosphatase
VSWPTVIAMNGIMHPYFGVTYVTLIASAAVYSRHHWIIDITFGLFIAIGMSILAGRIVNWL